MVPVVASAVNPLGCEFHPLARPYWYTLSSLRTAFFIMQTLYCTLSRRRCFADFYTNTGVDAFMQTMGWALLCERWGGHFHANAGVDTFMSTLGWTSFCKRWGRHFDAKAGVDTFMQAPGQTLLRKRIHAAIQQKQTIFI